MQQIITEEKPAQNLRAYVAGRFAQWYDTLDEEHREMWHGPDAIYDRNGAIEQALDELAHAGITCKSQVRNFDMEA